MFSIFRKNKAEAQDEAREGSVSSTVEPKVARIEPAPKLKNTTVHNYDLGCQSKLNRKLGGRMFEDYSS